MAFQCGSVLLHLDLLINVEVIPTAAGGQPQAARWSFHGGMSFGSPK